jgi:hypothetical protein
MASNNIASAKNSGQGLDRRFILASELVTGNWKLETIVVQIIFWSRGCAKPPSGLAGRACCPEKPAEASTPVLTK